jgi:hypothetical protein
MLHHRRECYTTAANVTPTPRMLHQRRECHTFVTRLKHGGGFWVKKLAI